MDRLLGATSRNFVESEPAAEVSTASPRGPVMEDFSEADSKVGVATSYFEFAKHSADA